MNMNHLKVPFSQFSVPARSSAFTGVVGAKYLVGNKNGTELIVVIVKHVPVDLQGVGYGGVPAYAGVHVRQAGLVEHLCEIT